MARKGYGVRAMGVAVLMLLMLAAGGCSAKDGVSDKPPAKGSGCSLGIMRLLG